MVNGLIRSLDMKWNENIKIGESKFSTFGHRANVGKYLRSWWAKQSQFYLFSSKFSFFAIFFLFFSSFPLNLTSVRGYPRLLWLQNTHTHTQTNIRTNVAFQWFLKKRFFTFSICQKHCYYILRKNSLSLISLKYMNTLLN